MDKLHTTGYRAPKHTKWIVKLHRHLFKPPYPVRVPCPNCSHWMFWVNATTIEVENSHGMDHKDLMARDAWMKYKHNCGALITVYWNE